MSLATFQEAFEEECRFVDPDLSTFDGLMTTAETHMLGNMPALSEAEVDHFRGIFSDAVCAAGLSRDRKRANLG